MNLSVVKLGLTEYETVLNLQLRIQNLVQAGAIDNTLLLLEHNPVITLGRNGSNSNILVDEELLILEGINVCKSDRGGDVNCHGLGQVVGYPIINLNYLGRDIKDYINRLEWMFMRLLKKEYGLISNRLPGYSGDWIENERILDLGCSIKNWVTMDGFSFNVNNNLEHFRWIDSCNFQYKEMTSLKKKLGTVQDMETVMNLIIKHFAAAFHMKPQIIEREVFLRDRGGI